MSERSTRLLQQQQIQQDNPGHLPQPIAGKAIWPVEVFNAPGRIAPDLARYICVIPRGTEITGLKVGRDGIVVGASEVNRFYPFTFSPAKDDYTYLLSVPARDGQPDFKEFTSKWVSPVEPIYVTARKPRRTSGRGWGRAQQTTREARVRISEEVNPPRIQNALRAGTEIADFNFRDFVDLTPYIPRDVKEIPYPNNDIRYLAAAANSEFGYTWRRGRIASDFVVSNSFIYSVGAMPRAVYYGNRQYTRLAVGREDGFDIWGVGLIYQDGDQQRVVSVHNQGDLSLVWNRLFNVLGQNPTNLDNFKFVVYRSALYGVKRGGSISQRTAFIQARNGFDANLDSLQVTLKQFGFGNRLLSQSRKTLPTQSAVEPEVGYLEFTTHTPEQVTKLEIESNQPALLLNVAFGSPRVFNDQSAQIIELSDRPSAQLYVQGTAPAIRIPSTAAANPETLSLGYQDVAWDGTTFKLAKTNDPAWVLLDVLTNVRWKVNLPLDRIDILSFYQASHYNNGLSAPSSLSDRRPRRILTDRKWCFDGPLVGETDEVISNLLLSMNAVFNQTSQGKYRLTQERPEQARWLIDQTVCNGPITYREALVKPTVVARLTDNLTGNPQILPVVDLVTKTVDYPGQNGDCALRFARWASFEQSDLLSSVEFSLPIKATDCADWYELNLYDIVEVYDSVISGSQISGRVTQVSTDHQAIQLDNVPREFWPSRVTPVYEGFNDMGFGGVNGQPGANDRGIEGVNGWLRADDWGMRVRVMRPGGGILELPVTWAMWRADQPRENWIGVSPGGISPGNVWAVTGPQVSVKPRLFRVISITETGGGLFQSVIARPYYPGMHNLVDAGESVPVPTDYLYRPKCGGQWRSFQGPLQDLPTNYPSDKGNIGDYLSSCVQPL